MNSGAGNQIQTTGFYLAGFLSLVLAVLKLRAIVDWSWWRVMLPLWVFLLITPPRSWLVSFAYSSQDMEKMRKRRSSPLTRPISCGVISSRRYYVASSSWITY